MQDFTENKRGRIYVSDVGNCWILLTRLKGQASVQRYGGRVPEWSLSEPKIKQKSAHYNVSVFHQQCLKGTS